jgi:NAD(P)-dependent dehydrogenase (short-subunit alcohol dehydrogenase family)
MLKRIDEKMRLKEKVSLITGGASGIGKAISLLFAQEGSDVLINEINKQEADVVSKEIRNMGRRSQVYIADVGYEESVQTMIEQIIDEFGQIDILVNNAGIADFVSVNEITENKWDRMIRTHLTGTFNCSKAVLKFMIQRKRGKILNISSVAGKRGDFMGNAHYTAAKAGINGLTRSLAAFSAPFGVYVNAIAPGLTETKFVKLMSSELVKTTKERIPLRRLAKPKEIAEAALFMVSDAASYIVGEVLNVNGGSYMD